MTALWIFLGIAALLLFLGVSLYNRIVALKQNRDNAFSDIDVQLQQRYDLVPQLVETVKGYAAHESEVLKNVTDARAGVKNAQNQEGRLDAERSLGSALVNLFAVAEAYPDLKADQNFRQLMSELSDIENKLAAARRYFNNATREYNTAIQQFPGNIVANIFNFSDQPYYDVDEDERELMEQRPDVKF